LGTVPNDDQRSRSSRKLYLHHVRGRLLCLIIHLAHSRETGRIRYHGIGTIHGDACKHPRHAQGDWLDPLMRGVIIVLLGVGVALVMRGVEVTLVMLDVPVILPVPIVMLGGLLDYDK